MREISTGVWSMESQGLFNIPKAIVRGKDGWRVTSAVGTFWEYPDATYGNHLYSLKAAVQFAVTLGSLPYEETIKYVGLTHKGRLHETGVLGVYYRTGLQQGYKVIYNGQVIKVPYCDGKGFSRAVRALEAIKDDQLEYLLNKF